MNAGYGIFAATSPVTVVESDASTSSPASFTAAMTSDGGDMFLTTSADADCAPGQRRILAAAYASSVAGNPYNGDTFRMTLDASRSATD